MGEISVVLPGEGLAGAAWRGQRARSNEWGCLRHGTARAEGENSSQTSERERVSESRREECRAYAFSRSGSVLSRVGAFAQRRWSVRAYRVLLLRDGALGVLTVRYRLST